MGGLRLPPRARPRPATPPSPAGSRARTCAPRALTPSRAHAARMGKRRFGEAQRGTQRPGAGIGLGRGGARPRPGASAREDIARFSWTPTKAVDAVSSKVTQERAALLSETSREYGVCDLVPPLLEMKVAYCVD